MAPPGRKPAIVAITVDRSAEDLNAIGAALDADAIQLSGDEPPSLLAKLDRPAWKVLHLPPAPASEHNREAPKFNKSARGRKASAPAEYASIGIDSETAR